jgi:hypothetical protein
VILALAGALAVPALQPALESTRIEAAARRVASFLDDARRVSVLERAALVVRCVPGERRLVVEGGGEAAAKLRFPTLPASVTAFSCTPERVTYLPQGSATGFTMELRDSRGRGRRLTVGAFTGLARVETAD